MSTGEHVIYLIQETGGSFDDVYTTTIGWRQDLAEAEELVGRIQDDYRRLRAEFQRQQKVIHDEYPAPRWGHPMSNKQQTDYHTAWKAIRRLEFQVADRLLDGTFGLNENHLRSSTSTSWCVESVSDVIFHHVSVTPDFTPECSTGGANTSMANAIEHPTDKTSKG